MWRLQQFLPGHTPRAPSIYENPHWVNTPVIHWPIPSPRQNQEWVCIMWNYPQHVWTTRIRQPSQNITQRTARRTWIYRGRPHTWPFQAWKQAHLVHINSGWFWGKIHWRRTRQAPNVCPQTLLQDGRGLEGRVILWNYPELELRWRVRWHINA